MPDAHKVEKSCLGEHVSQAMNSVAKTEVLLRKSAELAAQCISTYQLKVAFSVSAAVAYPCCCGSLMRKEHCSQLRFKPDFADQPTFSMDREWHVHFAAHKFARMPSPVGR